MPTNIDTGAIIAPISMLSRSIDLGAKLFANWRYDPDGGENPDFVLNQPRYRNSADPARRAEFRLRQLARGRGLGADALRHPLRDRAELRRDLLQQRLPERICLPVTLPRAETVHRLADAVTAAPEPV